MAKKKIDILAKKLGKVFTGDYNDLDNKPTITTPTPQVNADWNATSGVAQILNKPSIVTATQFSSNILYVAANAPITNNGQSRSTALLGGINTPFQSLQALINVASTGDKIVFLSDVTENVNVPSSLNLTFIGNGNTATINLTLTGGTTHRFDFIHFYFIRAGVTNTQSTINLTLNFMNNYCVGSGTTIAPSPYNSSSTGYFVYNTATSGSVNLFFRNNNYITNNLNSLSNTNFGITNIIININAGITGRFVVENATRFNIFNFTTGLQKQFINCADIRIGLLNSSLFAGAGTTTNFVFDNITLDYIINVNIRGNVIFKFLSVFTGYIYQLRMSITSSYYSIIFENTTPATIVIEKCSFIFNQGINAHIQNASSTSSFVLIDNNYSNTNLLLNTGGGTILQDINNKLVNYNNVQLPNLSV